MVEDDNIPWKVLKYKFFFLYLPMFGMNTRNYGPEKVFVFEQKLCIQKNICIYRQCKYCSLETSTNYASRKVLLNCIFKNIFLGSGVGNICDEDTQGSLNSFYLLTQIAYRVAV